MTRAQAGRTFALRFHAYGKRRYVRLGTEEEGWNRKRATEELENVLADVRRGMWRPSHADETTEAPPEPTLHEFASEWLESRRHEFAAPTVDDYTLTLSHHLLPFFKDHRLSEIAAQEADRYKATKVREREQGEVDRPLSRLHRRNRNEALTRMAGLLTDEAESSAAAEWPSTGDQGIQRPAKANPHIAQQRAPDEREQLELPVGATREME